MYFLKFREINEKLGFFFFKKKKKRKKINTAWTPT
jgi:hypothetical protein